MNSTNVNFDRVFPPARPFTKWVGGKHALVPKIMAMLSPFDGYIEPFVGAGALFFALAPRVATISDANAALMTTYRALQWDPEAVIKKLKTYENNAASYYATRAKQFSVGDEIERAADFIYVLKLARYGLYRENKTGGFNTPYCKESQIKFCDETNLLAVAESLQGVQLAHGDFSRAVTSARAGNLVYFDPPYIPLSATSNFTNYTAAGFTYQDHVRLRDSAWTLKRRGVQVVISNSSAPAVLDLYRDGFDIEFVDCRRSINSKACGRRPVKEVLIR